MLRFYSIFDLLNGGLGEQKRLKKKKKNLTDLKLLNSIQQAKKEEVVCHHYKCHFVHFNK